MNFYDTKALLRYYKDIESPFIISSATAKQLSQMEEDRSLDPDVVSIARKVSKFLATTDLVTYIQTTDFDMKVLRDHSIEINPTTLTVASVYELTCHRQDIPKINKPLLDSLNDEEVIFYSDNIYCRELATNVFHIKCNEYKNEKIYKGYKLIEGDSEYLNEYLTNPTKFDDWYANEYLIGHNVDDDSRFEMRYYNNSFHQLHLPDAKLIKGMLYRDVHLTY